MLLLAFIVKNSALLFCVLFIILDQLSRLHMILKPFMLRRVKKDVENELSDKVRVKISVYLLICTALVVYAEFEKIRLG